MLVTPLRILRATALVGSADLIFKVKFEGLPHTPAEALRPLHSAFHFQGTSNSQHYYMATVDLMGSKANP
jgi:hypothetical protein